MDPFRYYYIQLTQTLLQLYIDNPLLYNRELTELKYGFPVQITDESLIHTKSNYYEDGVLLLCNYKGRRCNGPKMIDLPPTSVEAISAYQEIRKKNHISSEYVFCNFAGEKLKSYQISQLLKKSCGNTARDFKV